MYYPCVPPAATHPAALDAVIEHLFQAVRPPAAPPEWLARDLTLGQLRLLFQLEIGGALAMGAIARMGGMSVQSATALIERIEQRNLVERRHRTDDRRIVECGLTDAGRLLVHEAAGYHKDAWRAALAHLHPDELAVFHALILRMLERRA